MHSGEQMAEVDLLHLFANQITLTGVYTGTMQEFKDMLGFLASKKVVPHIGQVLPLAKAKEGFRQFLEGNTAGKIVVEM